MVNSLKTGDVLKVKTTMTRALESKTNYPKTQTIIGPDFFKRSDEIMRPYLIAHKNAKNPNIAFGAPETREK